MNILEAFEKLTKGSHIRCKTFGKSFNFQIEINSTRAFNEYLFSAREVLSEAWEATETHKNEEGVFYRKYPE